MPIRFEPALTGPAEVVEGVSVYPGQMAGVLTEIPAFPGEGFSLGLPESIGDAERALWFGSVHPRWSRDADGHWTSRAAVEGELEYGLTVATTEDTVDIRVVLTNLSDRLWAHSLAFNCFNAGGAPSVADHECARHWVGLAGEARRLTELPRTCGPRPTVQLYSVEGAPAGSEIGFVSGFRATPENLTLEGWIAIQARDGVRMVAAASKPTLFLFQNMEYSCIHASPGLGRLSRGESGEALTRIYFVEATVAELRDRIRSEMA